MKKYNAIEMQMQFVSKKVEELQKTIVENPCYYVAWNTEEFFKYSYQLTLLKELQEKLAKGLEYAVDKSYEYYLSRILKSYNVMERSTSDMHRLTSLWKHEVEIDWVEKVKGFAE